MNERIKKVRNWLRGNVVSPSTPNSFILSEFELNLDDMSGSFSLTLENIKFPSRFTFSVEVDGRYEIYPPLYISPMGVPSSYPSIELTDDTKDEIEKLLNSFLPEIKPLGIDRESGEMIDRNTPMKKRVIDSEYSHWVKDELISDGFRLGSEIKK